MAFVRVVGRPNSNLLVGYPGIPATLPRVVGTVEIRPNVGVSAPVSVLSVMIALQKRESIHPSADSMLKTHLASARKEMTEVVGTERLLFRAAPGNRPDDVLAMDLPFVLFIPAGDTATQKLPPASLQLGSRTAETCYELVVTIQHTQTDVRKYPTPVLLARYDTLSTFGMYNRIETAENQSDHIAILNVSLPKLSYGPLDPITINVRLSPNLDWMSKAKRVSIQKITVGIEECITYNPEGDEPTTKVNRIAKKQQVVGVRLPENGYFISMGLVFPSKDTRDSDGAVLKPKDGLPNYAVGAFTTRATLYKVEYFLVVKAHLASAKDIQLRQSITVCPLDYADCKEEMEAIEQAAKDAGIINPERPEMPPPVIVRPNDHDALKSLGIAMVGQLKRPLIE